jgi:AcrR family transcriptional regulator
VVAKAGVTERTFYDLFANFDECYLATFDEGLGRLSQAVEHAAARGGRWLDRVRAGVVGLLGFLDDEPRWARLLLSEAPVTGALALTCQQRLLAVLTRLLDDTQAGTFAQPRCFPALTAELVAGGVFCVIRARIVEDQGEAETLVELAPSLMSFIAAQYGRPSTISEPVQTDQRPLSISRAAELPIRATHRTILVLRAIAHAPYSNNREVAQAAGLADEGQTSKLLSRLERKGVIENVGVGAARGEPNAWLLTPAGRRTVELLAAGAGGAARVTDIGAMGTGARGGV